MSCLRNQLRGYCWIVGHDCSICHYREDKKYVTGICFRDDKQCFYNNINNFNDDKEKMTFKIVEARNAFSNET